MPYEKHKVDGYQVKNEETGEVHAKGTSKAKAEAQMRLLQGVEHGMVPRGSKPQTTRQAAGLDKEAKAMKKRSKAGRASKASRSSRGRSRR